MSAVYVALAGVIFATLGWIWASRVNIIVNRRHHTYKMLHEQVASKEFERHRVRVRKSHIAGLRPDAGSGDARERAYAASVDYLLNQYEFIAAAVWIGDIDERLVFRSEHSRMAVLVDRYRDYMKRERDEHAADTGLEGSTIWSEFETLVDRWDKPQKPNLLEWKYELFSLRPAPSIGIKSLCDLARLALAVPAHQHWLRAQHQTRAIATKGDIKGADKP